MNVNGETLAELDGVRDRAIRLFTFLQELSNLRTKAIRSIKSYEQDGQVLWLADIPHEPECYCLAWESEEQARSTEVWIEIHKPSLKPPPEVPERLNQWLRPEQIRNSSLDYPPLIEQTELSEDIDENSNIAGHVVTGMSEDSSEIESIWEEYISDQWWPWAEEDKRKQSVQKIYTALYGIYQQQQRLGEAYEVVLGLGYLTWKTPTGQNVDRHLVTAKASVLFDAARGVISVGPSAEGAKPTLEQDMLEPEERPEPKELAQIEQNIAEVPDTILDTDDIHTVLIAWINSVPEGFSYDISLSSEKNISSRPKVSFAPAIILRKRTERNLARVFSSICEQIQDPKVPLPPGIEKLVRDPETLNGNSSQITESRGDTSIGLDEIYFPLPANKEQLDIVHQISRLQGVLVQGPPGTGKSHTIANLICHLLATGKRVLVTSHTPRALEVLHDKLPEKIAPLCVVALGSDQKSMRSLEDSVRNITEFHNLWNSKQKEQDISTLADELDSIRREKSRILGELRSIREVETFRHPAMFGSYEGTAQQIACRLQEEASLYDWILVHPNENEDAPLNDDEALELLSLLREFTEDKERDLSKQSIDPRLLNPPNDFSSMVASESEAIKKYEAAKEFGNKAEYGPLSRLPVEKREALLSALLDLRNTYNSLTRDIRPWVKEAVVSTLAGNAAPWKELLRATRYKLDQMGDLTQQIHVVDGLSSRNSSQVKADASAVLKHLEAGKKLNWGPFRSRAIKDRQYLVKEISVNGDLCNTASSLRKLLEWISIEDHLKFLSNLWSKYVESSNSPQNIQRVEYQQLSDQLEECLGMDSKVEPIRQLIEGIPGIQEPIWHEVKELEALGNTILAVTVEESLRKLQHSFEDITKTLSQVCRSSEAHNSVKQLLEAVQNRNEQLYREAHSISCELEESRAKVKRCDELLQLLAIGSEPLSEQLSSSFSDSIWDERLASFTNSWNWARAGEWLKRFSNPERQQQLIQQLDELQRKLGQSMAKLAAAKAWQHCMSRLTQHECQYLRAWSLAVKRIRGGTGKYANMHRKEARENMEQCRSAIPAWIMPIYRVAETIDIKPGIFDVVIIDEASQSGPEALFLEYIAKHILVVGDAEQISPQFVGVNKQTVEELRRRHIPDLPHKEAIGVDDSFYDLAYIRYQAQISLQEHFRCMPEIIQFSNNLCYKSTPLIPLKQYGAGRLTPTVKTVYVRDGYQEGRSPRITNPPEAEAIVRTIAQCCSDETYSEKTMGVIVLLGEAQAKYIQSLLIERIGPEEMEKRRLHCGNAYAFQGDERDVIFLSMVSAPGDHRIAVLSRREDKQRFNVAASRAKEQMWLFHSATLNDLSPLCLRYQLLEYCQNPKVEQADVSGVDIGHLRLLSSTSRRHEDRPPDPFDSWFEVNVFLMIHDRGYRVIPQYEVSGYRIDLLIEGLKGRLAVECDGDKWHGPEQYEYDMGRQRQLERCGYNFWRVRGSAFYHDPENAMESLWMTLREAEIFPSGHDTDPASAAYITPEQTSEDSSEETMAIGTLELTSDPDGATVLLAGAVIGTTELKQEVDSGNYQLTLRKEFYGDWSGNIEIRDGETTRESVQLEPDFGTLDIQVEPADAGILVDGVDRGRKSAQLKLYPGRHQVEVSRDRYESVEREVVILCGKTEALQVKLKPKTGILRVFSTPEEARIIIDGAEHGATPNVITELPTGDHKLVLSKDGYTDYEETVTISWNDPQERKVELSSVPPPVITGKDEDGAEMVLIPAGEFQMGSDDGRDNENPVHTVYIDAFYMDKYEVTNDQYKKFMDATGHKAPMYWDDPKFTAPSHPVVGVSWHDATAYAEWAGKRLPTEAEWEKAARGSLKDKKYPLGDSLSHDDANYSGTGGKDHWSGTSPVGSFAANGYGLYDMAGNVWEWCMDGYGKDYYSSSPKNNPTGPSRGTRRVLRGGSCYNFEFNLRCASRGYDVPTLTDFNVGFRCSE